MKLLFAAPTFDTIHPEIIAISLIILVVLLIAYFLHKKLRDFSNSQWEIHHEMIKQRKVDPEYDKEITEWKTFTSKDEIDTFFEILVANKHILFYSEFLKGFQTGYIFNNEIETPVPQIKISYQILTFLHQGIEYDFENPKLFRYCKSKFKDFENILFSNPNRKKIVYSWKERKEDEDVLCGFPEFDPNNYIYFTKLQKSIFTQINY